MRAFLIIMTGILGYSAACADDLKKPATGSQTVADPAPRTADLDAIIPVGIKFAELKPLPSAKADWKLVRDSKGWLKVPPILSQGSFVGPYRDQRDPISDPPQWEVEHDGLVVLVTEMNQHGNWPPQEEIDVVHQELEPKGWRAVAMLTVAGTHGSMPCSVLVKRFKTGEKIAFHHPPFGDYYLVRCDDKILGELRKLATKPAVALQNPLTTGANPSPPSQDIPKPAVPVPAVQKPKIRISGLKSHDGNPIAWQRLGDKKIFQLFSPSLNETLIAGPFSTGPDPRKQPSLMTTEAGLVLLAIKSRLPNTSDEQAALKKELAGRGLTGTGMYLMNSGNTPSLFLLVGTQMDHEQKISSRVAADETYYVLKGGPKELDAISGSIPLDLLLTSNAASIADDSIRVPAPSVKPPTSTGPLPNKEKSSPSAVKEMPSQTATRTAPVSPSPPGASRLEDVPKPAIPPVTMARAKQASMASERFALASAHARDSATPILNREIVRQALLLSVREEFGLRTHDASLREFKNESVAQKPALDILVTQDTQQAPGIVSIVIFRDSKSGPQILWSKKVTSPSPADEKAAAIRLGNIATDWLISFGEAWARKEFKELLTKEGLKPRTRIIKDAPLDERIVERFNNFDEYSQFLTLRALHEVISQSGETPQRLEYLARTYANLGSLTHRLYSAHSHVFFARAFLYAERLRVREPQQAASYWTRAYVNALSGRHACAVLDLDEAEALTRISLAKAGTTTMPGWTRAIRAACNFREKDLAECGRLDENTASLADHLQLVLRSFEWSQMQRVDAAEKVLERNANTLQAYELCSYKTPLGIQRLNNEGGWARQPLALIETLKQESELPAPLRLLARSETVNNMQSDTGRRKAAEQLQQSGDSAADKGEPSWRCLAALTEEIQFLQMYRYCVTSRELLAVPAEKVLSPFRPLLKGHPHYALLDSLCRRVSPDAAQNQDLTDVGGAHEDLAIWIDAATDRKEFGATYELVSRRLALTYLDMGNRLSRSIERRRGEDALFQLPKVSPESPVLAAVGCYFGKTDANRFAELERKFSDSLTVQSALWNLYVDKKQFVDAIRCGERRIAIAPTESAAYWDLATAYLKQEDREKWKSTLDRFLKIESYGLEDDRARVDIALWLMKNKKFDEAKLYSYEAAKCNSRWALECAATCSQHLQDWEMTEYCLGALTQRYSPEYSYRWFVLCQEIGHKNAAVAAPIAQRVVQAAFDKAPGNSAESMMVFLILSGQKQRAVEFGSDLASKLPAPPLMMITALLADELGNTVIRDKMLSFLAKIKLSPSAQLASRSNPQPDFQWVSNRFREMLTAGQGTRFNEAEYEDYIKSAPEITHDLTHFYMGWFMLNRKDEQTGIRYLKLAATSPDLAQSRSIARAALAAKKIDPGKIRAKQSQ